jgi:hypothetical protein
MRWFGTPEIERGEARVRRKLARSPQSLRRPCTSSKLVG